MKIQDPYISVVKGHPQLVDHIDKSPLKSVTPTIVKISDPVTNKPLCVLRNPKVPLRGFTSIEKCIDLHRFMVDQKHPDFGFDTVEIELIE